MPEITSTISTEATIEFEVYCGTCGAGLCHLTDVGPNRRGVPSIYVEACPTCLENAKDEGRQEAQE